MKILVTGGAGFIGSHIVDALVERGDDVVTVDDLSNGFERNVNRHAAFYRLDISERKLSQMFDRERPEIVIHQAAHTVVTASVTDPLRDARTNIMGSLNLISSCVRYGVKKIVYASSCALYGNPRYFPVDEAHPVAPIAPYGVSKHTVEHYLQVFHELFGLDYVALRYANVYGPRQNPVGEAGVVAVFARMMLAGQVPTIFGNGNKYRTYTYVEDVVRANILAITSGGGIYNIGVSEETSDQEMYEAIKHELGYQGTVKYAAERPGEISRMLLDCGKAARELKWKPEVSLKAGIAPTARYYRELKETSAHSLVT